MLGLLSLTVAGWASSFDTSLRVDLLGFRLGCCCFLFCVFGVGGAGAPEWAISCRIACFTELAVFDAAGVMIASLVCACSWLPVVVVVVDVVVVVEEVVDIADVFVVVAVKVVVEEEVVSPNVSSLQE